MPINKDPSTPPPVIGKIGPYTVFMTPPSTPKPPEEPPLHESPKKVAVPPAPPPVQPPPFDKSIASANAKSSLSNGSVSELFWDAVTKVQNAHSSLDEHLARWFGLNQSKYQWALDDYYESKGLLVVISSMIVTHLGRKTDGVSFLPEYNCNALGKKYHKLCMAMPFKLQLEALAVDAEPGVLALLAILRKRKT